MKTQIRKPVREKASYTKEYKEQALELWRASGRGKRRKGSLLCLLTYKHVLRLWRYGEEAARGI